MTMERLTHKRANGIKEGYWSPNKKQELVDTLAAYENTGLIPEQIRELKKRNILKPARPISEKNLYATCLNCRRIIFRGHRFCPDCGQRLRGEE